MTADAALRLVVASIQAAIADTEAKATTGCRPASPNYALGYRDGLKAAIVVARGELAALKAAS